MKRDYDAQVKNFLKEKEILAVILKYCVREFKDCDTQDIADKYIEGTPQVAKVILDRDAETTGDGSKIAGLATEDKSVNEGIVTFDIRFTALAPATGRQIKLIINVEAQRRSSRQGYPIVKRACYYCSGMISAQKNVEFTGMDYSKIKKVYSIWICQDMPDDRKGSIVTYDMCEHVIEGQPDLRLEKKENYDLQTIVIIGLDDLPREGASDVLRMLTGALSTGITSGDKREILKECGIRMTEPVKKAVREVCNLSEYVWERGVETGEERGVKTGRRQMLFDLVEKKILSVKAAASEAGMTETNFIAEMDSYFETVQQ